MNYVVNMGFNINSLDIRLVLFQTKRDEDVLGLSCIQQVIPLVELGQGVQLCDD
jgi:hypothetical protein